MTNECLICVYPQKFFCTQWIAYHKKKQPARNRLLFRYVLLLCLCISHAQPEQTGQQEDEDNQTEDLRQCHTNHCIDF